MGIKNLSIFGIYCRFFCVLMFFFKHTNGSDIDGERFNDYNNVSLSE